MGTAATVPRFHLVLCHIGGAIQHSTLPAVSGTAVAQPPYTGIGHGTAAAATPHGNAQP